MTEDTPLPTFIVKGVVQPIRDPSDQASDGQRLPQPVSDRPWLFKAGDERAVEAGRRGGSVKRKERIPEKLREAIEGRADRIVDAAVKRMLRDDSVGNRAFSDVHDIVYGPPVKRIEIDDASGWMQVVAGALGGAEGLARLASIDGDVRIIDSD